ncbi:UDP-3-O-acylglucosamine N-acyltransferase [Rickettsiales endosymbiont of Paramecium tredecaurelia]|uniref:UDP-3-O-(3-hydroxymyristoyl)glucosamine N-acyltransferase n=1 Tax=Candidatus Sarmatiella mevalonica TaxID=2770581 RepID=UPI0019228E9D|nr:UDP-3-O-(3-hydroxymyristoyl)glucosamine N-acyltransferase [Candidatus Sarmatiella mevalonica]MBL3284671.1 UDP-3-O-acylglucosamine N-acyltransferase [Candidatus Sarmatiella mevalonica]
MVNATNNQRQLLRERFYQRRAVPLFQIFNTIGVTPASDAQDCLINNISTLQDAQEQDVSFFSNPRYFQELIDSKAKVIFTAKEVGVLLQKKTLDKQIIITSNLQEVCSNLIDLFYQPVKTDSDIAKDAVIHPTAIIEDGVKIGSGSCIGPYCVISNAVIGEDVQVSAGSCIGKPGFGFTQKNGKYHAITHVGIVLIGDGANIGANVMIDRGSIGDTLIGEGCLIDNMVHIAHNVQIGRGTMIAAQTGIAGSSRIGDYCMIGGQVGISGHVFIGNRVHIAAKSGVMQDVQDGRKVGGIPATDLRLWHRQTVFLKEAVKYKG